jgi:hypothetical protein
MNLVDDNLVVIDFTSETLADEYDDIYGLLTPEETIVVRAYSDDTDDRVLDEIKPKFIIMFEPDMDFVRRIEVCSSPSYCSVLCNGSNHRSIKTPILHGLYEFLRGTQIPRWN